MYPEISLPKTKIQRKKHHTSIGEKTPNLFSRVTLREQLRRLTVAREDQRPWCASAGRSFSSENPSRSFPCPWLSKVSSAATEMPCVPHRLVLGRASPPASSSRRCCSSSVDVRRARKLTTRLTNQLLLKSSESTTPPLRSFTRWRE